MGKYINKWTLKKGTYTDISFVGFYQILFIYKLQFGKSENQQSKKFKNAAHFEDIDILTSNRVNVWTVCVYSVCLTLEEFD